MKYQAPSTVPDDIKEYQHWLVDELRHISDAVSSLETDTVLLKEWNVEPDKLYNGLVAYFDGTNFDPGDGRGVYVYDGGSWVKLGNGGGAGSPFDSPLVILADITTSSPPIFSNVITDRLELWDLLEAELLAHIGFQASGIFDIHSHVHGGQMSFRVQNNGGVEQTGLVIQPDAATSLYFSGLLQLSTLTDGIHLNLGKKVRFEGAVNEWADLRAVNANNSLELTHMNMTGGLILNAMMLTLKNEKLRLEGSDPTEFAEIEVISSNNSLRFSQTGLASGGLHGAWFEMPIRIRDGHDFIIYNATNSDNIRMVHNGTDLNVNSTQTRHFAFLSLTGRVRDGGFDLMQTRVATTATLVAIANLINTSDDKIAGYMIFNTTTSQPVWAVGPNDNSVWVDATGTTVHTPA